MVSMVACRLNNDNDNDNDNDDDVIGYSFFAVVRS